MLCPTHEISDTLGNGTIAPKAVVSADGKTRTVTQVGTNAQGQAVNITSVYERQ